MIIDVTGFGWSGSGAYFDLLREYDNVILPQGYRSDNEFQFLYIVDGLADLEYKLMHKHCRIFDSDYAIRRFLKMAKSLGESYSYKLLFNGNFYHYCKDFIDRLDGIYFTGRTIVDNHLEQLPFKNWLLVKLFCNRWSKMILPEKYSNRRRYLPLHQIAVYCCPQNFYDEVTRFIERLLSELRSNRSGILLTDHMFAPDNPSLTLKYFKDPVKCIVVRRDPRDLYLLAKNVIGHRVIPIDKVEDFIWFYKNTIEATKTQDSESILAMQYEDLIYKYQESCTKIEKFCGLKKNNHQYQYFQPQISINNTQLFRKYTDCAEDIRKIEKALPQSLYDFGQFQFKINRETKTF